MKVVFFEDVEGTARVGEVKEVKNGFARNFLLPRGIAGATTKDNLLRANTVAEKEARRQEKLDAEARTATKGLENIRVQIPARVGESGRLFGSVTNRDIAEALKASHGIEVDDRTVLLPEPIRDLSERQVTIRFTRNVSAEITVEVVPDEESKPVVARLLAEREAEAAEQAKAAAVAAYQAGERAAAADAGSTVEAEAGSEDESES